MRKVYKLKPYVYIQFLQVKEHERRQPISLEVSHLFLNIWHLNVPIFSPHLARRQGALWNHCYNL
jgi:hypothetical protein